jgi:hypothetical protein
VALKTVPALVVDIADAGATDGPPTTLLDSGPGFEFVFTSATSVISVVLYWFESPLHADWFPWLLALKTVTGSSPVRRSSG